MPDIPEVIPGKNGDLPPTPPVVATPPPTVPFDKDTALQDYINRTVENRLTDILTRINKAQPPAPPQGDSTAIGRSRDPHDEG